MWQFWVSIKYLLVWAKVSQEYQADTLQQCSKVHIFSMRTIKTIKVSKSQRKFTQFSSICTVFYWHMHIVPVSGLILAAKWKWNAGSTLFGCTPNLWKSCSLWTLGNGGTLCWVPTSMCLFRLVSVFLKEHITSVNKSYTEIPFHKMW